MQMALERLFQNPSIERAFNPCLFCRFSPGALPYKRLLYRISASNVYIEPQKFGDPSKFDIPCSIFDIF